MTKISKISQYERQLFQIWEIQRLYRRLSRCVWSYFDIFIWTYFETSPAWCKVDPDSIRDLYSTESGHVCEQNKYVVITISIYSQLQSGSRQQGYELASYSQLREKIPKFHSKASKKSNLENFDNDYTVLQFYHGIQTNVKDNQQEWQKLEHVITTITGMWGGKKMRNNYSRGRSITYTFQLTLLIGRFRNSKKKSVKQLLVCEEDVGEMLIGKFIRVYKNF